MTKKREPAVRYRDANTGLFVSADYAYANPKTTIRHVMPPRKGEPRITASAIEAAGKALYAKEWEKAPMQDWSAIPAVDREYWLASGRAALEAALPHMLEDDEPAGDEDPEPDTRDWY